MKHYVTVEWMDFSTSKEGRVVHAECHVFVSEESMRKALIQMWLHGAEASVVREDGVTHPFEHYTTKGEQALRHRLFTVRTDLGMTALQYHEHRLKELGVSECPTI